MDDKRLFHRYPSSLRAAFRVAGESFRGRITDVSVGGGFVATDAIPTVGARIQLASQVVRGDPSVWLDLRVTWVCDSPTSVQPEIGFGGYWLHASSRYGEDHLREFLSKVLGISGAVIRPMTPPAGGDVVYVYRFTDVYEGDVLAELPWEQRKPILPVSGGTVRRAGGRKRRRKKSGVGSRSTSGGRRSAFSADTIAMLDAGPDLSEADGAEQDDFESGLRALVGLSVGGASAPKDPMAGLGFDDPPSVELPASPAPAAAAEETSDDAGRWGFIVQKLSGIRMRTKTSGAAPAPKTLDLSSADFVARYRMGRRWCDAAVEKVEHSFLVFRPTGDLPELWSRVELRLALPVDGRRNKYVELHATVTRIKDVGDQSQVTCKINRVDERGAVGAFGQYVDAFKAR